MPLQLAHCYEYRIPLTTTTNVRLFECSNVDEGANDENGSNLNLNVIFFFRFRFCEFKFKIFFKRRNDNNNNDEDEENKTFVVVIVHFFSHSHYSIHKLLIDNFFLFGWNKIFQQKKNFFGFVIWPLLLFHSFIH